MANTGLKNNFIFYLDDDLPLSGTSVNITVDVETQSVVSITDPADITLISADGSTVERMRITAAAGLMTIVQRGIKNDDSETTDNALRKTWYAGQRVFITVHAAHFVSLAGNNAFTGNNTFSGTNTFTGITNFGALGDLNVLGQSNPQPVVGDITARNALYPSPVEGDRCDIIGLGAQRYNSFTMQWETFGISTPPPNASTSAAGLVKIAASLLDPDQVAGLYNMPTLSMVQSAVSSISTLVNSDYITGEYIAKGNVIFPETLPTFAQATTVQNIGDVSGNTRISFSFIGNGIAMSTFKLSLKKFLSPSVDLKARIETDNSGLPSGSLALGLTESTITAGSLTTSLADTTITLSGTASPLLGTRYHVVLYVGTYGSETINGTNYYGIGYYTNAYYSTRGVNKWSGSARLDFVKYDGGNILYEGFTGSVLNTTLLPSTFWGSIVGSLTVGGSLIYTSGTNGSERTNYVISNYTLSQSIISFQYTATDGNLSATTSTICGMLYRDANNYIKVLSNRTQGSGNTANTIVIKQGGSTVYTVSVGGFATTNYKIEYNRSTNSIKIFYYTTTWNQIGTTQTFTFTGNPKIGFDMWKVSGSYTSNSYISQVYMSEGIYGSATPYGNNLVVPYISGTGISNILNVNASALYSYKTSDVVKISDSNYAAGVLNKYFFHGIDKSLNYVSGTVYYLGDSPGKFCTAVGTNTKALGKSLANNQLFLYDTITP